MLSRIFSLTLLVTSSVVLLAAAERRPNIVLIFADDLGYHDTGFTGSTFFETPHLDRLAKAGMTFDQAYAGAGNCTPSRAALHSGQYSPRTGVYAVGRTDRGPRELQRLIPIPNREDLALENVTLAETLRAGGYATGLFGKWHLSGDAQVTPQQQGFDVYFDSRSPNPNKRRDEPDDPKGIYSLTLAAIDFMRTQRDRPFFAMISHHAIHGALEARPESLQRFKQKAERASEGDALYAACVYDLDDAVGVVIQALRNLGIEDDTLVIFTSDNGSTPRSSQEPLRGNKGCYYEGGIREPWIAYWPGKIQPGSRVSMPVINLDLYPTFLDAAGVKIPVGKVLDGVSLISIFTGKNESLSREAIFWHFPGYLDDPVPRGRDPVFRTRPVTVMRSGNWKLHLYHEEWQLNGGRASLSTNNAVELYDLDRDPGERDDLAVSRPEVRDRLLGSMLAWIDATDAKLPTERNPTYDPHTKPSREKRGKTRLDE